MDTQISASTPVHVVHVQPSGQRIWLHRVERREDPKNKVVRTVPVWDDEAENSQPMSFEFALVARERWHIERGIRVHFAFEPHGEFVAEEESSESVPYSEENYFVPTTADGLVGYLVQFARTPEGRMWCLKFKNPVLEAQSTFVPFAAGPSAAVAKAREIGRLAFEPPYEHPRAAEIRAANEAAAQRAANAEHARIHGRRRPGNHNI